MNGRGALGLLLIASLLLVTVEARFRHHKWKINYQTWSPDCVEVPVISINGQYPGSTIRAQVGDTIVVELENQMPTENVVIHWHGIRQAGTYFYHGHYGLQRSGGLYGSLIVHPAGNEPFRYDGELNVILDDWYHKSTYEQAVGLSSNPFVWVGEPQSLLIGGRGKYNCTLVGPGKACNITNTQCSPFVLSVKPGKTYRLRIASVASLSALNFLIQGHKMTVVEADGHYVKPVVLDNLDVYSGESYSVLITADQDPAHNYWAALSVRGRQPKTPMALAVVKYLPNPSAKFPATPPPSSPAWNDFAYSKSLARKFVARGGLEPLPPPKSDRQLILLNTQNRIGGYLKWAINNISLLPPSTPYLAAMKYRIRGAYNATPPPDVYQPRHYNIFDPPTNPNAAYGSGVYTFRLNSVVDVVLQNANTLTVNNSEIHPWHLHGHDFWILGFGDGVFDPQRDPRKYNLINPPLRNTVPLFPYGWTAIRFRADNPGVWAFHCHLEAHLFMGMGVMFAEGIQRVGNVPRSSMGCGLTRNLNAKMHH